MSIGTGMISSYVIFMGVMTIFFHENQQLLQLTMNGSNLHRSEVFVTREPVIAGVDCMRKRKLKLMIEISVENDIHWKILINDSWENN